MNCSTPAEYPFRTPNEDSGYRLFPSEMENDEHVAFHGTAEAKLQSIVDHGFRICGELESVSFAKNSNLALKYACDHRTQASPNGCVIVVRFESLNMGGMKVETSVIHIYKFLQQPKILGYCVVPADYEFV